MAAGRVKGITIEIGGDTTKLDKALGGVDHNLYTIQKDLQAVERRLKLDPTNTELLAQKQRLLADSVSETAKRMKTLDDAADGVQRAFSNMDLSDTQLRNFYLELELTESDLKAAEKALFDFNNGLGETSSPASDAAKGISNVGDAADEAADNVGGLSDFTRGASEALGLADVAAAGAAFTIGQKLVEGAMEAVKWLWNLDEATEEYREAMGKLNTAYETAGYSSETAMEAYRGFYAILGDTDTATEASQLLAQLANDEKEMANWIDIAAGVYGTFGDALPIEGLIEAANETAKVGKVTGVLADALNWVGISEDDFNRALEQNSSAADRSNYIMETLVRTYRDASDAFYENNEALIESREAQADLDESMAKVGESVSTVKTELLEAFGPTLTVLLDMAATGLNALVAPIRLIGDALEWLGDRVRDAANFFRDLFGVSGKLDENWNVVPSSSNASGSSRALPEPVLELSPSPFRMVTAQNLPHLANGTVTRPNNPFVAVVGDNHNEPEVISPVSTIRQAVGEALAAQGNMGVGRITIPITLELDGSVLARKMYSYNADESARRGPELVT